MQQRRARRLAGVAPDWLVDSMPIPVCRFGRGGYCKGFRGQAAFGHDVLQKQASYGLRLHLRTSRAGVILAYELAPANAADTAVLLELAPPSGTTGIGDRNYWSPPVQAELAEAGVQLLAPYRTKKHDPDPERSRQLSGPRFALVLSKSWTRWSQRCHSHTTAPVVLPVGLISMRESTSRWLSPVISGRRPAAMASSAVLRS